MNTKFPIIKIDSSPAMRRFNKAVEYADFVTVYLHDRVDVAELIWILRLNMHGPAHREAAIELERASAALEGEI
jgi:hypothetical protein